MQRNEFEMLPLFARFIKDSYKGKRLKPDGTRIQPQTVKNYEYVHRYLAEFEDKKQTAIRIKIIKGNNRRAFLAEKTYWKKFYREFTNFLYQDKQVYDNYAGMVIKTLRIFFNYLNREKGLATGNFYKDFYVCKEEPPIITLMPEQLQFLIYNEAFRIELSKPLLKAVDIFIFGCSTGLRVSDLFALKHSDIQKRPEGSYLSVLTKKTQTRIGIKLPSYGVTIVESFRQTCKGRKTIFPPIPPTRFNQQLKTIAELAGWTREIPRQRSLRGRAITQAIHSSGKPYRFCDLVSSHTMRRTAITTMLMLGMKEHVVKQISGHSTDSKSFYRYVNLVQSYVDNEMEGVFEKLVDGNRQ